MVLGQLTMASSSRPDGGPSESKHVHMVSADPLFEETDGWPSQLDIVQKLSSSPVVWGIEGACHQIIHTKPKNTRGQQSDVHLSTNFETEK